MSQPLTILIAEDDPADAELLVQELHRAGFEPDWRRVDNEKAYLAQLHSGIDLVLSDYRMPQFDGLRALELLKERGLEIPFIIVSGTIGEELAVTAMKLGAADYLLKDRLARLGPAVNHALEQNRLRRERIKAEQLVRESAASMAAAQEVGHFGSWELDLATTSEIERCPLRWSAQCCRIFGFEPGEVEVTNNLFFSLVHPDDRDAVRQTMATAMEKRQRYSIEHRIVLRDGEVRHVREDGRVFFDEKGNRPLKIVGTVHDITEERRTVAALREAHAQLHHMVARCPTVIYQLKLSGEDIQWHFVSENVLMLSGFTAAESLDSEWWREHLHPDDGAAAAASLHTAITQGTSRVEYRIKHKDGRYLWLEDRKRLLPGPNDESYEIVGGWTDITARKEAEAAASETGERFKRMAETIDEVFWMSEIETNRIVYVSPAYERLSGRTCAGLFQPPHTSFEAIDAADLPRVWAELAARKEGRPFDHEYRIVRPDGELRWVWDRGYPARNATGKITHYVGVAQDITQRRRLEEQFRQAQKMEAIGTLAGGIAHDFNNILGAIRGYSDLAKRELGSAPAVSHLDAVLRATDRATDLVRQILAFSRRQEQERKVVQLGQVVKEVLALLRATIPASIEFETSLATDLPNVLADTSQIHQVVMNLGTNAAHAMKDRPGRLTVKLENFEVDAKLAELNPSLSPGRYLRLSVSDTGHGMDAATLARIFEPFFTTKAPGEGTGLGLAVVHGIMQSHEGAMTVDSQPGTGTTFRLYFPAHAGEVEIATIRVDEVPVGHGERILFVDDEPALAFLGQRILERLGYVADAYTEPAEALAVVRAKPDAYDLVVTDHMMPELTGMDLAQQIRAIRPALPIILVTGYMATLSGERILSMGIRKLALKPLSVEALGVLVHQVLNEAKKA